MSETLTWSCRCGQVQAFLNPRSGTRLVCYCASCQAFKRHLGATGTLDPAGGSDLFQTAPDALNVTSGKDNISVLQLTPKGPYRWYAACCNTPMANTLATRKVPFLTLVVAGLDRPDALGPVRLRVNRRDARAPVDKVGSDLRDMALPLFARIFRAYLTGGWKGSPFFDSDGRPIATPHALDAAALDRAYGREHPT